jgi:hypothetical protein
MQGVVDISMIHLHKLLVTTKKQAKDAVFTPCIF